jgi:hypothetical protein
MNHWSSQRCLDSRPSASIASSPHPPNSTTPPVGSHARYCARLRPSRDMRPLVPSASENPTPACSYSDSYSNCPQRLAPMRIGVRVRVGPMPPKNRTHNPTRNRNRLPAPLPTPPCRSPNPKSKIANPKSPVLPQQNQGAQMSNMSALSALSNLVRQSASSASRRHVVVAASLLQLLNPQSQIQNPHPPTGRIMSPKIALGDKTQARITFAGAF